MPTNRFIKSPLKRLAKETVSDESGHGQVRFFDDYNNYAQILST